MKVRTYLERSVSAAVINARNQPKLTISFYKAVHNVCKKLGVSRAQLLNCDETGIALDRLGRQRVVGAVGRKTAPRILLEELAGRHATVTYLPFANAEGEILLHVVVVLGLARGNSDVRSLTPAQSAVVASSATDFLAFRTPNGFVNTQVFIASLRALVAKLPEGEKAVLLLDGCSTHLATDVVSEFCEHERLQLLYFPPNCTSFLQPLDVGVFNHVKREMQSALKGNRDLKSGDSLPMASTIRAVRLLDHAIEYGTIHSRIEAAFTKLGLPPTSSGAPSELLHDVHGAGAVASLQHAEDVAVHAFRHAVAVSDEGGGHMQLRSTPVAQARVESDIRSSVAATLSGRRSNSMQSRLQQYGGILSAASAQALRPGIPLIVREAAAQPPVIPELSASDIPPTGLRTSDFIEDSDETFSDSTETYVTSPPGPTQRARTGPTPPRMDLASILIQRHKEQRGRN